VERGSDHGSERYAQLQLVEQQLHD